VVQDFFKRVTNLDTGKLPDQTLDLTNCDREPIHIPGLIQPHGALLVLEEPNLNIIQVSSNTEAIIGRLPEALLGKPLSVLLSSKQIQLIRQCLSDDSEIINPIHLSIKLVNKLLHFDGILHRLGSIIILELEPKKAKDKTDFFLFYQQLRRSVPQIQQAPGLMEMCEIVVKEIRRITGFDRVMIYRFEEDESGYVIAEETNQDIAYLDLHYPASDIPKQARQLYTLSWLRLIPTVSYQPITLIPDLNPLTNQPLDLSQSVLRSVSPLHLEYLENMGVSASMSISLMQEKKLWGLIACHHASPKYTPYNVRAICQFIGQIMSVELMNKEALEDIDYKRQLKSLQTQFIEALSQAEYFLDGMVGLGSEILNLVNATGAVICSGKQYMSVGETPSQEEVSALLDWIKPSFQHSLFQTRSLSKDYPAAVSFKAIASGVIALEISKAHHNYMLWFRPEVLKTVNWAGNPNKPVEISQDGNVRMSPRKSFDTWKETARGYALPWKDCELEAVTELRSLIVGVVLRQADELASKNFELQRSNEDLDSFAYIASHDLKEPLRGIHNYANFLMEDYEQLLNEEGVTKLATLVRLTQRMEDMINSLLHFSQLGRADLTRKKVSLNELVQQAISTLTITRPQNEVEFRIPYLLPSIECDAAQIRELFTNLISNAIKYNDKINKWIEIGFDLGNTGSSYHTFYVRDNGIGISQEYFEKVFQVFRRLHDRDEFGGGTGVGLTITRKIVERHGGRIWIESTPTQGSTFYFTLATEINHP